MLGGNEYVHSSPSRSDACDYVWYGLRIFWLNDEMQRAEYSNHLLLQNLTLRSVSRVSSARKKQNVRNLQNNIAAQLII